MMESTKTVASMLMKSSTSRNTLKTRILATELMKKRCEEKAKSKRSLLMNNADLQIIGNDSQGFYPSLLVSSEGNSYLFNCSEGFQRFCYTAKIRLLALENVFITNLDWSRVSGGYGLSLTLQDVGSPNICIHSTDRIEGFFEAGRNFMQFTTGMKCRTRSASAGEYSDSGIRIQPVILDKSVSLKQNETETNKKAKCDSKLVAYICSFPDLPGALDAQRCKELNVPIGRHLATLKSGQDVELPDGRVIKSKDVCGPKNVGMKFIVVECPSISQLEYLLDNATLEQNRKFRSVDTKNQIDIVVHFTPKSVVDNPKYRNWMDGFAKNCKHILLSNNSSSRINFVDSYRLQYLLQKLDSKIFPTLYLPDELTQQVEEEFKIPTEQRCKKLYANREVDEVEETPSKLSNKRLDDDSTNIIEGGSLDRFVIRPRKVVETADEAIDIDLLLEEAKLDPHFQEEFDLLREKQKDLPEAKDYEPEVVFLGTGSALPSKLRNTSGILLNFSAPKHISVMMDVGEDTYGQLCRFYSPDRVEQVLKQLRIIYISHQHADHHVGLIRLLKERRKLTEEPVFLLLPPNVDSLLTYYNGNFEDLSDTYEIFSTHRMKTIPSTGFLHTNTSDIVKSELIQKLDGFLDDIAIVEVVHCVHSCAVVMKFKINHPDMDTFTVGYSGDARPSEDFIISGKGCDLLIHEATFDHRSTNDALTKKHCTSAEAIGVARQMKAKFAILTHFSQRLSKIPYFTEEFDDRIGFAFDNLALRCPSHYGRIPIMKPILNRVFARSIGDIDMKYFKQQARKQIIDELLQPKA